jgi:hypothetical protein
MTETITKNKPTMFESMLAIQKELKTITKNKKAFKGSYATLERIWEDTRKLINDNNFVVYHKSVIREGKNGLLTVAEHKTGGVLESFVEYSNNTDPQERGKEITYFRRYNINSIFNIIVEGEDNDATKKIGDYSKKVVDGTLAAQKLMDAENSEKAREIYKTLSAEERKTEEVIEAIKFIKENENSKS